MTNLLILLIAFLLGFSGVLGFQYFRAQQNEPAVSPVISQPTPEPTFALRPPSEAVLGILTVLTGQAQKFSRNEKEYKEASSGAEILLGESIATKINSSATATIGGIMKATLGPSAELVFANLFPDNFVLQQRSGRIDYLVTQPISVRALHTLATLAPGEVIINVVDTDISITVVNGSVKFALVDNDNNTKVYDLSRGQRANIDDEDREVFLVNTR